jgi:hypothetical protein
MVHGAKFRDDAARLNLDLDPQTGAKVAKTVSDIVTASPAIIAKVKAIADEGR